MKRYGIRFKKAYGVSIPVLRNMAKTIKKDHDLALQLWRQDIHEAKILATMIADPNKLSEKIMESWVRDFYSWDICDQCIMNYFEKHELAWKKAILVAEKIKLIENKHAQWVAGDALRELTSDSVKKRLYKK